MLKTEASAERNTLRSASPHRNAYRAEFQALKKAFDQPRQDGDPKLKDPEGVRQPRGRQYGAHVSRIKNMFMQMGTENTGSTRRSRDETSPQKLNKPTNFVNRADGSVVKFQHGNGERTAAGQHNTKFSETRKLFEQSSRDASQSPVYSYGREKRGSHEHLDDWRGARSNRGSTDSLDSLCSRTEASSPTTNRAPVLLSEEATEAEEGCTPQMAYRDMGRPARTTPVRDSLRHVVFTGRDPLSEAVDQVKPDEKKSQETPEVVDGPSEPKPNDEVNSTKAVDGSSAAAEVNDTAGNSHEATATKVHEDTDGHVKEESSRITEDQTEETNEEYCGSERVIFNADGDACYQGWGESCTDPEDDLYDDDLSYDPGSEITEIPGLPEEDKEDIPQKRKIRFSSAPIK
ncbi:hypothetical protein M9458_038103, partial [Cirrhinus mrigala]